MGCLATGDFGVTGDFEVTGDFGVSCGTVLQVGFLNLKPFKLFMSAVVVREDSGEVNVVHKQRLDFLDGYTRECGTQTTA